MSESEAIRLAFEAENFFSAGDQAKALDVIMRAVQADPNCHRALRNAAVLLSSVGRVEEALGYALRALEFFPNDLQVLVFAADSNFKKRNYSEAAELYRRAISLSPNVAIYHQNLGIALAQTSDDENAERELEKAIELNPGGEIVAFYSLAHLRALHEDFAGAITLYRKAHACDPGSPLGSVCLGAAFLYEGNNEEAIVHLDRAIKSQPINSAYTLLAIALQRLGRFKEAEDVILTSHDLGLNANAGYMGIAMGRKMTESDRPLLEKMRKAMKDGMATPMEACALQFAIGKSLDDLGNYEEAMRAYDSANERASQIFLHGEPFDRHELESKYEFAASTFTQEFFERYRCLGDESSKPIFIVGMMRSGTTLTEQILSCHPKIGAAGELNFWLRRDLGIFDDSGGTLQVDRLREVQVEYLKLLDRIAPGKEHVTNKTPGNYGVLGYIHLAFPNAKVIHCRRHPVATLLSNYMTPNSTPVRFGYKRENLVFGYRIYEKFMAAYKGALPASSILDVQYEELVAQKEKIVRGILEFLELDWSDACLHHESRGGAVNTPSMWQVRQPVYSSSVERWKRYEPWLGAFAELLPENEKPT